MARARTSVSLAVAVALTAGAASAEAQDIFGRRGIYDMTGDPRIRDKVLDYAYIRGEKPSFAEQRGLAGAPTVEVRRNFIYIQDSDGTLTIPYRSEGDIFRSFEFTMRELYRALPDEFVFVYTFTSFNTNVGAFFYQPEANDVRGMGEPTFDRNGSTPREGFVFMNWWLSFEELFGQGGAAFVQAQARSVFNQEAGHRWASFVQAGAGLNGGGADVLLGRDDSHWSYFVHTGGSPMEGNSWRDNGNGTFTTTTNFMNWRFSPLDLYLMGLIPPAEVPPFFAIGNPVVGNQQDMFGEVIHRGSPPQIFQPVSVSGTRVDITIDEIVARNGERMPRVGESPTRWRVVFVMLASQSRGLNESERVRFEGMVDDYALGFKEATNNLAELDYELAVVPKQPIGGLCQAREECDQLESSVCLIVPPAAPGTGLCTRPCSTNDDCPDWWCCQPASSGVEVCLPTDLCTQPEMPDAGMMPASPDAGITEMPQVCTCDETYSCDQGCEHCDPECAGNMAPCVCDVTYGCDLDERGGSCACDLECTGETGCGCASASDKSSGAGAGAAALIGTLIAGLFVFGRRFLRA